jgi:cytochrome c-type protein NapB
MSGPPDAHHVTLRFGRGAASTPNKEVIMRHRTLRRSGLVALLVLPALMAASAARDTEKETDDGLDVYFRDADLAALSDQELEKYIDVDAGESQLLGRDFPDAPPQIPHTVEDMLPIVFGDNACLDCHHPENTESEEDSPLPETHFERAVMAKGKPGDPMIWVVQGYEKAKDVVGSRFECSICHTPQATNVDTPTSSFVRIEVAPSK